MNLNLKQNKLGAMTHSFAFPGFALACLTRRSSNLATPLGPSSFPRTITGSLLRQGVRLPARARTSRRCLPKRGVEKRTQPVADSALRQVALPSAEPPSCFVDAWSTSNASLLSCKSSFGCGNGALVPGVSPSADRTLLQPKKMERDKSSVLPQSLDVLSPQNSTTP